MEQTIYIKGITCNSCVEKIKAIFEEKFNITDIVIEKDSGKVIYQHATFLKNSDISHVLEGTKYSISNIMPFLKETEAPISLSTYTPLFLLFGYILLFAILAESMSGEFNIMRFMQNFMAGFFISFSYFKLINLKEFALSYSMYDIVAKKWKKWGYIYAFVELGLGISYLIGLFPLLTNIITFLVMSVSITGVIQSVRKKQKIKCACLGAVFNLPMSTITIIEDALMILMSLIVILIII